MPIYHCKTSSLVDHIEIHSPRPGIAHASIIARENADAAGLECIRAALAERSLSTLMDSKDGRAVIEVRGLKNDKLLFSALSTLGLHAGDMHKEETADAKATGFFDRVRGKAMYLSALFYNLGNAAFIVSGIQRGRHNAGGKFTSNDISELMIGSAFFSGDLLMMKYGQDKGDEELRAVDMGLKRHLRQKGIGIPEGDALTPESLHDSGVLKATNHWLHRHIGRIKCLTEVAGGLFTIHAGMKLDHIGKRNNGKLLAGLLLSTGWLATFLLDKPRGHHILNGDAPESPTAAQVLANNPRGWIARPVSMGNNISNLIGSYGERNRLLDHVRQAETQARRNPTAEALSHLAFTQNKQRDYVWNVISACSFLVANGLFGLSGSRRPHETEDDKSMMNDLILLSANVVAKLPPQARKAAVGETAHYVAELAGVGLSAEQVETAINDKIDGLTHSAWTSRVQAKPRSSGPEI